MFVYIYMCIYMQTHTHTHTHTHIHVFNNCSCNTCSNAHTEEIASHILESPKLTQTGRQLNLS